MKREIHQHPTCMYKIATSIRPPRVLTIGIYMHACVYILGRGGVSFYCSSLAQLVFLLLKLASGRWWSREALKVYYKINAFHCASYILHHAYSYTYTCSQLQMSPCCPRPPHALLPSIYRATQVRTHWPRN